MGISYDALRKRLGGHRVLLDTSVLIAYFEASDSTHQVAVALIDDLVRKGTNPAVISPVVAMELLVLPLKRSASAAATIHDFMATFPNLAFVPIDLHIAQEAASLRATHGFKTPDALIIATGIVAQVGHLVTNDHAWREKLAAIKDRIHVTMLADYIS